MSLSSANRMKSEDNVSSKWLMSNENNYKNVLYNTSHITDANY